MVRGLRATIFLLRVSMGIIFFYAGITKVLDSGWTSKGYLMGAKTFSELFAWFAQTGNIGWVDMLNQWGLTLIGISLLIGILTRFSSFFGIILMILYYFPALQFPIAGAHSFIVDEHVIYALVLLLFMVTKAGNFYGVDGWLASRRRRYFK